MPQQFPCAKIPICAASFMETSNAEEAGRRTFQNATQTKTFRANCVFTVHYSPVCQWFDDNSADIVEQKARGTRIFGKGTHMELLRVTEPNLLLKWLLSSCDEESCSTVNLMRTTRNQPARCLLKVGSVLRVF